MRNHLAAVLVIFLRLSSGQITLGQQAPVPVGSAKSVASDSHEGITISVEPWIHASNYKEKFPKKSPFGGGIVGLHVTIRNNGDESVKVDLRQIRLLLILGEENRQELTPLTPDDVADAVLLKGTKDPTQRRNPLPMPVGKPNPTRDKNWTEFRDTCQNASIPSSVIASHSSMDGLVYFDLRSEWDLLQNAKVYVPNLVTMATNTPLSYFEIDLAGGGSQ